MASNEISELRKAVLAVATHIALSEKLRALDEEATGVRRGFEATPERCEVFTSLTDNLFEIRSAIKKLEGGN